MLPVQIADCLYQGPAVRASLPFRHLPRRDHRELVYLEIARRERAKKTKRKT